MLGEGGCVMEGTTMVGRGDVKELIERLSRHRN